MKKVFSQIYLTQYFFMVLLAVILLFIAGFIYPLAVILGKVGLGLMALVFMYQLYVLFRSRAGVTAIRHTTDKWSNSDENPVEIRLVSQLSHKVNVQVVDELPVQYQERNFKLELSLPAGKGHTIGYTVRPVDRGEYHYGAIRIFISTFFPLVERRLSHDADQMIPCYPSFLQLRKYELMAFTNKLRDHGIKRVRKLGDTMEFEQIKDYVRGDDVRNINWKATAKRGNLMINQFQDERSQHVYNIVDKGRVMAMPFNGLKLLDYALNATLVMSSIALKKGDKSGMMTFCEQTESVVKAQKRNSQMATILQTLYNVNTSFGESDYARLYVTLRRSLTQRSLLLLYTNFETMDALHRQLPYLQAIAKTHRLVVIFFRNTELDQLLDTEPEDVREIFDHTIAQKFVYEKKLIVNELNKYGIQAILTAPENLTVNTINKYLEIKARGVL